MPSKVEICNLALSHLAIGKEIANIETEKSEEAGAARRFYDITRDNVLRSFPWPFTTKVAVLGLVAKEPTSEWGYSYRYPTDCLYIRRILSTLRNDTRQTRVPYELAQDTAGILIFTDMDLAEIEYTAKSDNPQIYPSDFTLAFSYYLAFLMSPRLTGGDQFKLGEKAVGMYAAIISQAKSTGISEEQRDEEVDGEFIRTRE